MNKDTKYAKYGDAYYTNMAQRKITNLKKYGVTCVLNTQKSIEHRISNYKERAKNVDYVQWRKSLLTGPANGMYR